MAEKTIWGIHAGNSEDAEGLFFNKQVISLSKSIRLMDEIDEVIEEHGGWPG